MTKITAINSSAIQQQIAAAITVALADLGLTVRVKKNMRDRAGTYTTIEVDVMVALDGADAVPVGPDAEKFKAYATSEGMDPAWLGRPLPHPTLGELKIIGFRPRSTKAPVLARCSKDGKDYVFPVDGIRALARRAGWEVPKSFAEGLEERGAQWEQHHQKNAQG
jgi:hypothetical protein